MRVLVDARPANAHFKPPPSTELSSAAALGDTWVCPSPDQDPNDSLWSTACDIKDYFYRLGLPEELQEYFGLRPVDPRLLKSPLAREWVESGCHEVVPLFTCCHMCLSWSLHIAQKVHEHLFVGDKELKDVAMSSVRRPATKLYGDRVVGYAYVDDNGLVGFNAGHLGHLHEKFAMRSVETGLYVNLEKSHGPQTESIKFGLPC